MPAKDVLMTDRVLPAVIVLAAVAAWIPWARQDQTREAVSGGHMPSAGLPEECPTQMQTTDMQGAMMAGILAKEPDVAFVCGMIAHHQAAIGLARVGLKSWEDPEARTFAEQVMRDRGREIVEMKDWLKKFAGREGRR
jgi:uncharacterized protein (DUF305 family)